MRIVKLFLILMLTGEILLPQALFADITTAAQENKTVDQRLADLEREVQILKRLKDVDQEVILKKDSETPVVVAGKDGFALKSRDGNFILKLKGQVQADGRYFVADDTPNGANTYTMRRVRPILEGTLFKYFDFRLMPDFGGGTTTLQDAFIDFKYWQAAQLRVGKFKSPVGLERLQSDANKVFIEDSLTANLIPNRDVGIDLHGELWDGSVSYDAGVFNGTADGGSLADTDNHDDKDFAGRVFILPFKNSTHDSINGLGMGVGGSVGRSHGSAASPQLSTTFRTPGQQTFFTYLANAFADGARYRIVPQAHYYYGPLGLLGEWALSTQTLKNPSSRNQINNYAWQLGGSYVLTGENASYNGVIPRNNFDPANGKLGAFEVVSRLHWLTLDSDLFPDYASPTASAKRAKAWTFGMNWYLNKNLKFATDFEETFFDGGAANGGNRARENALLTRMQLVF